MGRKPLADCARSRLHSAMPTLRQPKPARRRALAKKPTARPKQPFKFELTSEDIALDNAISVAAARSLALRRAS